MQECLILAQVLWGNRPYDSSAGNRTVQQLLETFDALGGFDGLMEYGKFFTQQDLLEIADGTHALYAMQGTPSERLIQFFSELNSGYVSPAVVYDFWVKLLESCGGDELKAAIELEYHRPKKIS